MRSQLRLRQNALYRRLADAHFLAQLAARPMGAAIGWFLSSSPDHTGLHGRRRPARLASLMPALQAFHAGLLEPGLPLRHGGRTGPQLALDLAIAQTLGQRQD